MTSTEGSMLHNGGCFSPFAAILFFIVYPARIDFCGVLVPGQGDGQSEGQVQTTCWIWIRLQGVVMIVYIRVSNMPISK